MHDTPRSTTTMPAGRRTPGIYPWISGAALIVLGRIFLLRNAGVVGTIENWWALFMLIPAVVTAGTAWTQYQASGKRLTSVVGGSLVGSLTLTVVATIFLLDLPWRTAWPVFLIIAGMALALQRVSLNDSRAQGVRVLDHREHAWVCPLAWMIHERRGCGGFALESPPPPPSPREEIVADCSVDEGERDERAGYTGPGAGRVDRQACVWRAL